MAKLTIHCHPFSTLNQSWQDHLHLHKNNTLIITSSVHLKHSVYQTLCPTQDAADITVLTLEELAFQSYLLPAPHTEGLEKALLNHCLQQEKNPPFSKHSISSDSFIDRLYQLDRRLDRYQAHDAALHPYISQTLHQYHRLKSDIGLFNIRHFYECLAKDQYFPIRQSVAPYSILFLGFFEVPKTQLDLISAIIEIARDSHFFTCYQDKHPHYSTSHPLVSDLISQFPDHHIQMPNTPPIVPKYHLRTPTTPQEEVDTIIQCIYQHLDDDPLLKLQDIGIIMPNQHRYNDIITTLFDQYHLPFKMSVGTTMGNHSFGQFILLTLALLNTSIPLSTFIQWISHPITALLLPQNSPPIWPDYIHHLACRVGFNGNLSAWFTQWVMDYSTEPSQLDQLLTDASLRSHTTTQLSLLRTLFKHLDPLFSAGSPRKIVSCLAPLLHRIYSATQDPYQHHLITQLHHSLIALDQLYATLKSYPSLSNIQQDIHLLLHSLPQHPETPDSDAIHILGKREAFGSSHTILFMMGLVDGHWPQYESDTLFLSSNEQTRLGLPTQNSQYQENLYLFHTIRHQSPLVYLSYPSQVDNRESLPSHFIQMVETLEPASSSSVARWSEKAAQCALGKQLNAAQSLPQWAQAIHHFPDIELRRTALSNPLQSRSGNLAIPLIQTQLSTQFSEHRFSATELEQYQRCPHAYFYHSLLNLPQVDFSIEDITAQRWGTTLHQLLHDVFTVLPHAGSPKFLSTAKEVFETLSDSGFEWSVKSQLLFGTHYQDGLLNRMHDIARSDDTSLRPMALEAEFGTDDAPPILIQSKDQTLHLRGHIDMVLSDSNHQLFCVLDYKTGSQLPNTQDLQSFHSLQLPIYFLAAHYLYPNMDGIGGIIYHTKDVENCTQKVLFTTPKGQSDIFDLGRQKPLVIDPSFVSSLETHILALRRSIQTGHFGWNDPAISKRSIQKRTQSCQFCRYFKVCRSPYRYSGVPA